MKNLLRLLLILVVSAGLVACGDDDDDSASASSANAPEASGGTFPATVAHRYGTTTVKSKPKRIVVVGLTEQDTVLALGYKPIATTEWYGEQPSAVWPWAQKYLGSAKPTVLKAPDGFPFEKIASLRPDLIIGTNAGMSKSDYEKLSALAPTVAGLKGDTDYFGSWDQQAIQVATALGKERQGRELVDDVKKKFAEVAEKYPQLKGKTVTFSQNGFYGGLIYVYPDGLNTEFLTYLGMRMNPKITALAKKPGEQAAISAERLGALDADAIVFATESPNDIKKLDEVPTFKKLKAVSENRSVYTDRILSGAIYFITPLSMPYLVDRLAPQLADAVAGKQPKRMIDTTKALPTAAG